MDEGFQSVRLKALEVFKELKCPFSKWEFFKRYSAHFGSKPPHAELGFANLCDFIESFPEVQLVRSPGLYAFKEETPAEETTILLKPGDGQESEGRTKLPSQPIIEHSDDESTILSRSTDEDDSSPSEVSEDDGETDKGNGVMPGEERLDEEEKIVKDSSVDDNNNSSSEEEQSSFGKDLPETAENVDKTQKATESSQRGFLELPTEETEEEEPMPVAGGTELDESSTISEKPVISSRSGEKSTENKEDEPQLHVGREGTEKSSSSPLKVHLETSDEEDDEEKEKTLRRVDPNENPVTTTTLPTFEEFKTRALELAETLPPSFHVTRFTSAYCVKYCVSSVPFEELGFSTLLECFHEIPKIFNRLVMSGETTPSPSTSFEGAVRSADASSRSSSSSIEELPVPPPKSMPLNEFQTRAIEVAALLPSSFDIEQFYGSYCEKYCVSSVPFKEFGYSTLIDCLEKIPEIRDRVELILAPASLDEFKTRALEVTQYSNSTSIPRFSQAYCRKYRAHTVPYKKLGFSTLFECLQAIPEVAARVDMSLETNLLDIIRPWKNAFTLKEIHNHYRRRIHQYLHYKRHGYTTIYQLMASLPGVRQIDYYDFIFEGENSKEAASIDDKASFREKTPIPEHPPESSGGGLRSPYAKNEPKTFPPLNLTLFNARALTAVADRCQFCCVRQFSQIYCEFYRTHYVPYEELGFSTLLECLQTIPEIANYVDMNFEMEVLDIVSNYKTSFRADEVMRSYRIRNNVTVVPFPRYGYKNIGDLLCSLPGVTMSRGNTFSYEKKKQSECEPESDHLSQMGETESIYTNETKSLAEASSFTFKNYLGTISDVPEPSQSPSHCSCQSATTKTSPVSRNESIGRFITSLLDDAERKGLDANDMAVKTINFAMGFYPKTK